MSRSYEKDLWDGNDAVYERYKVGKATLVDMGKFAAELASAEEKCGKSMLSLHQSKTHWTEKGTFGRSWGLVRLQHESDANAYTDFSGTLLSAICRPVELLRKEQASNKSKYQQELANHDRELQRSQAALEKTRVAYHRASENSEHALSNYEKARQDPNFPPKNLTKLHTTHNKLKKEMEDCDSTYKKQLEEHRQNQAKYEANVKQLLSAFEKMELERLSKCKDMLLNYVKAHEQIVKSRKATIANLRSAVNDINIQADIQSFIGLCKTNESPEPYVVYEPYQPQHPELHATTAPTASSGPDSNRASKSLFSRKSHKFPNSPTNSITTSRTSTSSDISNSSLANSGGGVKDIAPPPTAALPPPSATGDLKTSGQLTRSGSGSLTQHSNSHSPVLSATPVLKAKAMFSYDAQESNELSFPEGAIIDVTLQDPSGWWTGNYNGMSGMFPGNFAKLIADSDVPAPAPPSLPPATSVRTAVVTYEFEASSPDELSLKPGDKLTILNETGGWVVARNERGEEGCCPGTFLKFDN